MEGVDAPLEGSVALVAGATLGAGADRHRARRRRPAVYCTRRAQRRVDIGGMIHYFSKY
jgi:hypothetical protein